MAERKFTGFSSPRNFFRESNDEVLNLEAELRKAYCLKMLEAQVAEKTANCLFEEIRQKFEDKMTFKNIETEIRRETQEENTSISRKHEEYKHELEKQIQLKEENRKQIQKQEWNERNMLIKIDEIREKEEKLKKQTNLLQLRERIEKDYLIQQEIKEILKSKNEESDEEVNEKNRKYFEVLEERNMQIKKQNEEQIKKREEMIQEVSKMVINDDPDKNERQKLIDELVAEEIQCQEIMWERKQYLKRIKEKDELVNVLNEQMSFNVKCKIRFLEKDKYFAEAVMKQILEDERLERQTHEAKRRKTIKYKEELERLMDEKRLLREKQIAEIQEELQAAQLQEKMLRDCISDERISLLETHSGSVSKFINKTKLTEEEQKFFNEYLTLQN